MRNQHFANNLGTLAGQKREESKRQDTLMLVRRQLEDVRGGILILRDDSESWRKAFAHVIDAEAAFLEFVKAVRDGRKQ